MARFAAETSVSVEQSRLEIERTLQRYEAEAFAYSSEGRRATVMFRLAGRFIRLDLTLPDPEAREFTHHSQGPRSATSARTAWEKACRQRWRAMLLIIKAKLEAVASGITTIEDEFLANTVLPDGHTVGEWAKDEVPRLYKEGGEPRPLMLSGPGGR